MVVVWLVVVLVAAHQLLVHHGGVARPAGEGCPEEEPGLLGEVVVSGVVEGSGGPAGAAVACCPSAAWRGRRGGRGVRRWWTPGVRVRG